MSKFYNDEYNAGEKVERAKVSFSDLLLAYLQIKDSIKAADELAKHLGISVDDVDEWLKGESLPGRKLLQRIINIIRGDAYHAVKGNGDVQCSTWADIVEIVHEAENVQAFYNLKITHSK